MGKWTKIQLSEISISYSGGTPKRDKKEYFEGNIPWVSSSEVNLPYIDKTKENITELGLQNSSAKWIPKNSVLIAMYGATAGQVSKLLIDATSNQAVLAIIPNYEKLHADFLYYQLKLKKNKILFHAQGSGQPNLSKELIDKVKIELPEIHEQTRIAEILNSADEAIAQTEALIAKYQRIKTGLMQDLLTCGIDENGTIRSKATHKFVVKNGIEVPEEWEVEQIENHCIHSAFGPRFSGNLYSISGNIGTLRTTDLDIEGNINYKTIPFANLNIKDFESHLLMEDDLLITRSGTVGVVSVFKEQTFHVIPGAFLIRFRLKNSILPEFLRFYFRNEIGKRKLLDIAEGGVQKNIRGSSILKLFVPIPSPVEQKEINKRLSQIENLIQDHDNLLSKLQSLKTGLMQDLLSGKVRVKIEENEMS